MIYIQKLGLQRSGVIESLSGRVPEMVCASLAKTGSEE